MKKIPLCLFIVLLFLNFSFKDKNADLPYKNPKLSVEDRVNDLIQRMSVEEKVAQLLCMTGTNQNFFIDSTGKFNEKRANVSLKYGLGESNAIPTDQINAVQKYLVEKTRLGIPVLIHGEALHGIMAPNYSCFPQAIAMAGTWNPDLLEKEMSIVAAEARSVGLHQVLCPVVDVVRDLRWGRLEETYGEDPYLVSRMAIAAVKGLQGTNGEVDSTHVIATLKHFAGYGNPEGGINCAPNNVSERVFREVYLYPFEQAIHVGGAISVMASYNDRDGLPSHANEWLLRTILRKEWGFQGLVVSDYFGVERLHVWQHVAENDTMAALTALKSGVNIELPDRKCYPALVALVKNGKVSNQLLNESVRLVLKWKFKLGLFENPYVITSSITSDKEKSNLALVAAQEAIIMLKNSNNTAPLDIKKYKTIAVIGPNSVDTMLGGYSGNPRHFVSILEGIKQKAGTSVKILNHRGCNIKDSTEKSFDIASERKLVKEAVSIAKNADVIVLAIGGNAETDRESWPGSPGTLSKAGDPDHYGDRTSLSMVGLQVEMASQLMGLGKPVIVFILGGKPFVEPLIYNKAAVVYQCWALGQETGSAIADVLFGDYNPGGKLTLSIPRSMGHLPAFYNYKPSANNKSERMGYLFDDASPLFPFGFGLSYTNFSFTNFQVFPKTVKPGENVKVSVKVTNTGTRKGDEVVQLYIRDNVSSVTRPIKELKDFKRITLEAGESKLVEFTITPDKLAFYNVEMKKVVEPGEFTVMIGNSSADKDLQKVVFLVTE